jgi:hypothetical protein
MRERQGLKPEVLPSNVDDPRISDDDDPRFSDEDSLGLLGWLLDALGEALTNLPLELHH